LKSTAPVEELARNMPWVSRFSPGMVRFIGVVLPALTRILPVLTPVAAVALSLVMALAAGHHLMNGEANALAPNIDLYFRVAEGEASHHIGEECRAEVVGGGEAQLAGGDFLLLGE
jgi:hypothetical protein